MPDLSILFEDEHFVAIDKPTGMLVHATKLARQVREIAIRQLGKQLGQRLHSVHRLDRPTSGVLLFARHPDAARAIGELFEQHKLTKTYIALVRGHAPECGTVDMPLLELLDKTTDGKARSDKEPQEAITDYETLDQVEYPHPVGRYATARYSLMQLRPRTGRRHQIRRHLKHLNYPILGDRKHGDRDHNAFFVEHFQVKRMFLVARELQFTHPLTDTEVRISAPLGDVFERMLEQLHFTVRL